MVTNIKPNILIITELFPNVINKFLGSFVVNQLNYLSRYYHIVVITTHYVPLLKKKIHKQPFYYIYNGMEVYSIKYYPLWLNILHYLKLLSHHRALSINKFLTARKITHLAKKLNKNKHFLLVHGHEIYIGDESARVGKILHIPSVFTLHGLAEYHKKCFGPKIVESALKNMKIAQKIIAVSNIALNSYKKIGLDREYEIIPNGYDPIIKYEKPQNITIEKSFTNLLIVGFLVDEKRVTMAIKLTKSLKDSGKNVRLYIVGLGPDEMILKELTSKLDLIDNVFFTGQIKPEQMPFMFNNVDLLVHPSIVDSFSMVILEAMSYGLPIVCTNKIGIVEYLRNDFDSIIIEPDDQNQLNQRVADLLNDPVKMKLIAINAKHTAEKFSCREQVGKILKIYKKIGN